MERPSHPLHIHTRPERAIPKSGLDELLVQLALLRLLRLELARKLLNLLAGVLRRLGHAVSVTSATKYELSEAKNKTDSLPGDEHKNLQATPAPRLRGSGGWPSQ